MPSTGLLPFLHIMSIKTTKNQERVNALNGLTSISTTDSEIKQKVDAVCQCPQRAYFHFYTIDIFMHSMRKRVNALNGLTSISTIDNWYYAWIGIVSMPSTGLLPFLR